MDKSQQYNTGHPHAAPNFRNLIIKPMWMTMKTALRTVPFLGRLGLLKNNYHFSMDPLKFCGGERRGALGEASHSCHAWLSRGAYRSGAGP